MREEPAEAAVRQERAVRADRWEARCPGAEHGLRQGQSADGQRAEPAHRVGPPVLREAADRLRRQQAVSGDDHVQPDEQPDQLGRAERGLRGDRPQGGLDPRLPSSGQPQLGLGANDVAFFQPLYDQITANLCIDKARVFAAGESSGGDFSSILGCEHADKLRAVARAPRRTYPSTRSTPSTRKCTGQVTACRHPRKARLGGRDGQRPEDARLL